MTALPGRSLGQTLRRAWLSDSSLIVLAAVAFLLADAVIVFIAAHGDFAIDFTCCYQQAGQRLLDDPSTLYAWTDTYTFRYSPWAAVLFTPLAPLSEPMAVWAWLALKVGLVAALAVGVARRWPRSIAPLAAGMVLFFPPIWHDLALGNVSVFTFAVLWLLLVRPNGLGGVAFGLLLLLAPKPHLLPIALWLAIRRPRDAAAALVAGVVLGPYTFIHYLAGLLVAVDPVLRSRPRWLAPYPWLLVVFPLIHVWLLGLAWTMWRSPDPPVDGAVGGAPPAAGPG